MTTATAHGTRGGEWLIVATDPGTVMTRERITDEHRLIEQSTAEFMSGEVLPVLDRLEQKDWALNRVLLQKCGALGLLGTNVSDSYGGVDLDKVATLIVSEQVAVNASFAATFGAQANLTILPIYLFGTEAQKTTYLPALVAGDLAGAYCLSESGSGSDALGAAAKALRQADGSFALSGEKMWITNGGFADVFIVFAKVDGEHFTAFIVERGWPGVSSGKEEHKMGLHGSSTTPVILQDVAVPAGAVLGEIGKGHKVAFNVLNFGRFKLGAMTSGGAKNAIADSARYAAARKQFGVPIASFGAIRHKLGEMTAREYALESLLYRAAGLSTRPSTPREARPRRCCRRWRSSRSRRRLPRSTAARPWTTSSTRACRFTVAMASSPTIRWSGATATRGSIASSKARTRSTACSSRACSSRRP
mgnify:CR=1 FL=1